MADGCRISELEMSRDSEMFVCFVASADFVHKSETNNELAWSVPPRGFDWSSDKHSNNNRIFLETINNPLKS